MKKIAVCTFDIGLECRELEKLIEINLTHKNQKNQMNDIGIQNNQLIGRNPSNCSYLKNQ